MKVGVVITVGPGRRENLLEALRCVGNQLARPEHVVIVCDGMRAAQEGSLEEARLQTQPVPLDYLVLMEPHEPGHEQPRNAGVRLLQELSPECTHVWFLDSDIIVQPNCLLHYKLAQKAVQEDRILVGPYEWLSPNERLPLPQLHNDPRWVSFSQYSPSDVLREDIGAGLACFSGNLVWPIKEFAEIGGFWDEIHHGRCEDGELGLRATALGIPISFVPEARGWHLWHPVDLERAKARNARDVPMLNARHPWVEGAGLAVVPKDGRRFDCRCPGCGESINTLDWWTHRATCGQIPPEGTIIPDAMPVVETPPEPEPYVALAPEPEVAPEPEFIGFPKIARLFRDITITEKLDGTNAAVVVTEDGTVYAQSRKRVITPDQDNFGFAGWVAEHEDELREGLGEGHHFGEWYGLGIQRGYDLEEKRFALFNTDRFTDEHPACCWVVPVVLRGMFGMEIVDEAMDILQAEGSLAVPGYDKPEGIVIRHTQSRQMFKVTLENDEQPKALAA